METTMFDELCSERILLQAWKTVKAKGSAGGVDGMSIEEMDGDIGSHIKSIQQQLKTGEWNPQPYLTIKIPKKNSEYRKLGLLSVKDKIVQQAIRKIMASNIKCRQWQTLSILLYYVAVYLYQVMRFHIARKME